MSVYLKEYLITVIKRMDLVFWSGIYQKSNYSELSAYCVYIAYTLTLILKSILKNLTFKYDEINRKYMKKLFRITNILSRNLLEKRLTKNCFKIAKATTHSHPLTHSHF